MQTSQIKPKKYQQQQILNQGQFIQVVIHPYKKEKFNICLELNENIYDQIRKYFVGDILITIQGQVCSTNQTLTDFAEKLMTQEFKMKVYTFDDIIQKINFQRELITELALDEQTRSKIILRRKQMKSNIKASVRQFTKEESKIIPNNKEDNSQQNRLAYISQMIKTHQNELQKLSSINKNIIENKNIQESEIYSVLQFCFFCQLPIKENAVQTNCRHHYHVNCLDNLIQAQISQKQPIIKCICNMNQKISILNNLDDEFAVQNYRQQLIIIQLYIIKQANKNRIQQCPNRSCQFFYIKDKVQNGPNFCPNCLLNIPQK